MPKRHISISEPELEQPVESASTTAMDADTVADLLGVTDRQLFNYIKLKNLPCSGERNKRTFHWPDVLKWYVDYQKSIDKRFGNGLSESEIISYGDDEDEDLPTSGGNENLQQATLRKVRADAHLKELTLAKQRGEVIVIADAKDRLDRLFGNLRTKLLNLAPKLAGRLEGARQRTEREAVIASEMEAVCTELSTGVIIAEAPVQGAEDVEVSHAGS